MRNDMSAETRLRQVAKSKEDPLGKVLEEIRMQEAADKRTKTTGMEIPIIIGVFFGLGLLQNAVIWIIGTVGELLGWL